LRRVLAALSLGVGVALLLLGILGKPLIYDELTTVPLDQKSTSVSEGSDMSVLRLWAEGDQAHYDKLTGVTVRSTRQVLGIPGAVPENQRSTTAVWQTGVKSEAVGVGPLTYSNEVVTFDRTTGLTTGSATDTRSAGELDDPAKMVPVTHEGLFFKFPFAVEKKTYPWWDGDLGRAAEMTFVREETLFGVDTYVFEQVTPRTEVAAREVPAGVFDRTGDDIQAQVVYANTRTLWVEPNTGVLIKGQEVLDKALVSTAGEVATTKGTIGYTDETVRKNAEEWGTKGKLLGFVGGALRPVGIVLGLVLIALGIVLFVVRPRASGSSDDDGTGGLDDLEGLTRRSRRAA
jgi:Porin PorA